MEKRSLPTAAPHRLLPFSLARTKFRKLVGFWLVALCIESRRYKIAKAERLE